MQHFCQFETLLCENVYYYKNHIKMRKRTSGISQGDFFEEDALISYHRLVRKTIQDYVQSLIRHQRYLSIVGDVMDGTVLDDRSDLIDLYDSCLLQDAHLQAVLETLYSNMIGERYCLGREVNGKFIVDEKESKKIQGSQFEKIIKAIIDSTLYGYSCVEIMPDVDPDTGRLVEVNAIERRNILPNQHRIVQRQGQWLPGWNLDDIKYKHNYILINSGGLGLFSATTPLVLAKKFTIANWVNFAHTYGQPIIHGKTGSEDEGSRQRLASKISNAAQKKVLVTGKDDEIDIKTFTMSNSEKIYDNLKNHTNSEISNLILGSESMAGGMHAYVGSTKAHEDIFRARIKKYRRITTNVMNEDVLPPLKYMDFIAPDVEFRYSNQIEMSDENKIKLYDVLTNKYKIESDAIEKEFGIQVGEQFNITSVGSGIGWGDDDDDDHRMSDHEYELRYGHPRAKARVNFLEET